MKLCSRHLIGRTLLLAMSLVIPFVPAARGQVQTLKMPIQKPAPLTPSNPAEMKDAAPAPVRPGSYGNVDFDLEMKKIDTLIQLNERNPEAYFNRAWLFQFKGDVQKALQDYTKAIELDKGMADAFYNRGLLFARMKRYEEALKDFSEVIRLEPSIADGFCNRGNIYFQMGKLDLALNDYSAGLKSKPGDADLLYNRALVHLAKGDKSAANEDLKKSAELFHDRTRKEFPELASQPPLALKQAAIDGRVVEFLGFMPDELQQKIRDFEGIRAKVENGLLELEKNAKQSLGEKVRRQGNTLAFSIQGTDPRWTDVFGPKWPEMIKQNPTEPRIFHMSLGLAWKEEAQVLQQFQACLENPSFCQEAVPQNSALHMKRLNGSWKLVDGKTPEQWKEVQVMGQGIVEIIEWVNRSLSENKGKMADEEMVINLAKGYMQKIMALTSQKK